MRHVERLIILLLPVRYFNDDSFLFEMDTAVRTEDLFLAFPTALKDFHFDSMTAAGAIPLLYNDKIPVTVVACLDEAPRAATKFGQKRSPSWAPIE